MKYLSTFSGIGGFEIGINKAYETIYNQSKDEGLQTTRDMPNTNSNDVERATCVGYSEIDKYAIQIYQSKFPKHKNYGDITKINEKELPDFDLFVGGFPCQAFSIAGKRGGFDDTRGTLFFDCARILKEKQPRNFILENVKGLLSHDNGRTFKTIINTLTELGYCVEWQVLNAKNFGVPQNRERVFIVGHLGGIPERKVFPIRETTSGTIKIRARGKHQQDFVYGTDGIMGTFSAGTHASTPHLTKILDGGQAYRVYDKKGISPTLPTPSGGNHIPQIYEKEMPMQLQRVEEILESESPSRTDLSKAKIRRLTPLECERLMGYPDNWTEGLSDTQRYKTLGNGIVSNVVAEVVKRLYSNPSQITEDNK